MPLRGHLSRSKRPTTQNGRLCPLSACVISYVGAYNELGGSLTGVLTRLCYFQAVRATSALHGLSTELPRSGDSTLAHQSIAVEQRRARVVS